jgi:hypothetical protein
MEYIQRSRANSTAQKIDSKKLIFTFMFRGCSLLALDDFPKGVNINSQYFGGLVLHETIRTVISMTHLSGTEEAMSNI